MLLFIHPIIQGPYLSINALRCRAKPKLIKICQDYLLVFHISNSSGQGKVKGNEDAAERVQRVKSKRKGLLQVLEELGDEERGKRTEVEA